MLRVIVGDVFVVKGVVVSSTELRNQIAKCRRLARFSDAETARRLLALADEYEARAAQSPHQ